MASYRDGSPARVGDIVRGVGYNVGHEVSGMVIRLTDDASIPNIVIACVTKNSTVSFRGLFVGMPGKDFGPVGLPKITADHEYGRSEHFDKLA